MLEQVILRLPNFPLGNMKVNWLRYITGFAEQYMPAATTTTTTSTTTTATNVPLK